MAESVKVSGPLFEHPDLAVRQAVEKGMLQAALLGQRLWQEQATPRHGVRTGTYRRSIVGTTGAWNQGVVSSPMVYAQWLEDGKRSGRQTRFAGYQFAEHTRDKLERANLERFFGDAVTKALGGA